MLVTFAAGDAGGWRITRTLAVRGESLAPCARLCMAEAGAPAPPSTWSLRGVVSNARYTTAQERDRLVAVQPALGRAEATRGALIPIRKSAAWWALAQDERRAIYEERSRHTTIGLNYLPRIARRLHHSRDLGEAFDFLTWFEFAPEHESAFDDLLGQLRASEEWSYVEREFEVRVSRDG